MPSLIKINTDKLDKLIDKGIHPKTIELLTGAKKIGAVFSSKKDLEAIGVSKDEIDKLIPIISLAPSQDEKSIKSAIIKTDLQNTSGYILCISYNHQETLVRIEEVFSIDENNETEVRYDDKVLADFIMVSVKNPTGDFSTIEIGTDKGITLQVKKAVLNGTKIKVQPLKQIVTSSNKILTASKITGRLLSNHSSKKLENIQVIIEAALDKDNNGIPVFFPVCYAETESLGYFITSQPQFTNIEDSKKVIGARARIGLKDIGPIPIRLDNFDQNSGTGEIPDKLILFFEEKINGDEEGDCGCEDLNFHNKRVLDEFSFYSVVRTTEPMIESFEIADTETIDLSDLVDDPEILPILNGKRLPSDVIRDFISKKGAITKQNYQSLISIASKYNQLQTLDNKSTVEKKPAIKKKGRVDLDGTVNVDWDERPTIYQSTSIAHGHILHFKQEWFSDGYSMGDIIYSLPLAPGQKKQIVVFDWDRKDSAARTEQLDYQDLLYNSLSRDRDINEIAKATVKEHLEGESSATTMGAAAGAGAIIPGAPVLVGGGAGIGHSFSSASQDSSRSTTGSSRQHIIDKTIQAANSIRSQRSTVVQTVSQGERFEVSAEVVANYNHCHAMTIQYFEVLRHFEVRTKLAGVQECLFIPLQITPFDRKKALRWRDTLTRVLKNRTLAKGFDALERYDDAVEKCGTGSKQCIDEHYDSLGIPNDRYAEEVLEYLEGELYIEFDIKRPRNNDEDEFDEVSWRYYTPILGNPREFYDTYIKHERRKDDAFAKHAGPRVVQEFLERIKISSIDKDGHENILPIDASLLSSFKNRTKLNISLRMNGAIGNIRREDVNFISVSISEPNTAKKELLTALLDESLRITVHSGSMRFKTRNLHEELFNNRNIKNDLTIEGDNVRIFTPLSTKSMKRPRLEDVELSNAILHHLNENVEYYHQWLWVKMNPQRRFMLLDGIIAPGKAKGRSVASVVENRLIGIAGNCLIMPVAPGFQLDPLLDEKIDLFEHYYENPKDPIRLALPTKGVFAEAVMGKCNSCEKVDNSRFWKWEESPIPDDPTSINPFTIPIPQNIPPTGLQAKDFSQPIINLQNAPVLPDPQGLGALIGLLGNGNLFKDVTGLNENQKNALASLQAAFTTAQAFGNQAGGLTPLFMKQQVLDQIKSAKENGMLTEEQAQKKTEQFFDSILGTTGTSTSTAIEDLKKVKESVEKKEISEESGKEIEDIIIDFENAKVETVKTENKKNGSFSPASLDFKLIVTFRNTDGRIFLSDELSVFDPRYVFEASDGNAAGTFTFSGSTFGTIIEDFKLTSGDLEILLLDEGGVPFSGKDTFLISRKAKGLSVDAKMDKKTVSVTFSDSEAITDTISRTISGEMGGKIAPSVQIKLAEIVSATIANEVNGKLAGAISTTTGTTNTTGVSINFPVDIPTGNLTLRIKEI